MSDASAPRRRSRLPQGQLERLGRIGWMARELTIGGAASEGAASARLSGANARRLAKRLSAMRLDRIERKLDGKPAAQSA